MSIVLGAYVGSFVNMAVYRLPRRIGRGDLRAERRRLQAGGPPAAGAAWQDWVADIPALPAADRQRLLRARGADEQLAAFDAAEAALVSAPHAWRSCCPQCRHPLGFWDLVPLVSYLLLRGRCRHCRRPIGVRYFIVEALCVGIFVSVFWAVFRPTLTDGWLLMDLFVYWVFGAVLLAVFFIDLDHRIIPHELVVIGLAVGAGRDLIGLAAHRYPPVFIADPTGTIAGFPVPPSLLGAALGFALFAGIDLAGRLVFRRAETMGGGDANLGAAIGAVLGPWSALLSFGAAVVLGGVMGAALMAVWALRAGVRGAVGHYMPFGPYMAVSAFALLLLAAAYGQQGLLDGVLTGWEWWVDTVGG